MKIAEMLVQNGEKHDDTLHMKAGPVNIRLYRENKTYRELIGNVIDYMTMVLEFDFEDYPRAQGISGANVGIPLNIVIVNAKHGPQVFLNPMIGKKSKDNVTAKSNCGSLNLGKSITVARRRWVWVRYYDLNGDRRLRKYEVGDGGIISSATLQHEIDHNLGILITEREVVK
jgi:peptide deformylase